MTNTIGFNLRLPPALHKQLGEAVNTSGRASLHAEILARLTQSLGPDPRVGQVMEALELPEAVRLRHANTGASVTHILLMAELFNIERLVLAARADPLNDAVLVMLLQTASHTIVLDKTQLSMARRPRQLEIMALFRGLDECGWLDIAEYRPTLIAQDAMPAAAAAAAALLLQDLKPLADVGQFLKLLAPHGEFDVKDFPGPKPPGAKARAKRRKP